ncbi:hypothetical protein RhiJN_03857 [Ceratobasidium sp. AG-Ba]|nr:hypothetical protein RhiJN_03857 [Ceratobasidium sp. AG-Ba]
MKRRVASASSRGIRVVSYGTQLGSSSSSRSSSGVQRIARTYTQTQINARVREAPGLREQTLRDHFTAVQQQVYVQLNGDGFGPSGSGQGQSEESHWVDLDHNDDSINDATSAADNDPLDEVLQGTNTSKHRRRLRRSWEERGRSQTANWAVQKERLALALLRWKHGHPDEAGTHAVPSGHVPPDVSVMAIDIFGRTQRTFTGQYGDACANEVLIRHGYLGTSPLAPRVAISIECLKLYRALRSRCSTLGMETFVKALGDLHNAQSRSHHVEQFSCAFVVYDDLELLLDRQLEVLLGRTDPLWRPKHNCPSCSYELVDEPPLLPRKMFSMDGNSSLKRLRKGGHADTGSYTTSYFVPRSVVDSFANQTTRVRPPTPPPEHPVDDVNPDVDQEPDTGPLAIGVGPTDGELLTSTCASNWRAAQAQHNKKTSSVFDETGVFLACCRHGLVAFITDMVQSGELAKYPMAIFQALIDVHGSDIVIAYDIACSFIKTLERSMTLCEIRKLYRTRLIVPIFHAYAHNRLCQIGWNPRWKPDLGLEDFEWCERIFSSSNGVARCTRHASASMRLRYLELHYRCWDGSREGSIGQFLYRNYMQADSIIAQCESYLEKLPPDLQVADNEVDGLVRAEYTYLTNLKHERPEDTLRVDYVTQLQALEVAEANFEKSWGVSSSSFSSGSPIVPSTSNEVTRQRKSAQRRLTNVLAMVERLEADLDISVRWTPAMTEYIQAATYANKRDYQLALGRMKSLAIQRLFELSRLNVAGICHKMRRHVSKSLQSRSRALGTAVKKVNLAAKKLGLDQREILIEKVLSYQFIAEFDLLEICDSDVRKERWAQQGVRDTIDARLQIRRAKAERNRVEIEARRLATFISDEGEQLRLLAGQLESTGQHLQACQVLSYANKRIALNAQNQIWLKKLFSYPTYDGNTSVGTPKNTYPVPAAPKPTQGGNNQWIGSGSDILVASQDPFHESASEDESEDEATGFAISEYFSAHMD